MHSQLHDNNTIDLFLDVKLIKNNDVYFSLNRKAESFLYTFGAVLFNSMFNKTLLCKDIGGSYFTPRSATSGSIPFMFGSGENNTYIVLSSSTSDQTLNFGDYKITVPLGNLTCVPGNPQYNIESGSDYLNLKIIDKWIYAGSNTVITASALYYKTVYDTSGNGHQVMLAKDVFDPAIDLQNNSLIEWSYIIKISL
jgi:hypothetical protein